MKGLTRPHACGKSALRPEREVGGELSEAARQLQLAVRLSPEWPRARVRLGAVLVASGRTAEAVTQYSRALKLAPDLTEALNSLAWIRAASSEVQFRNG